MSAQRWIPRIVGGTDYGDGKNMPDRTRPRSGFVNEVHEPKNHFVRRTNGEIIETTHEQLAEYANSIPSELNVTWEYGPLQTIPFGTMVIRGQYVTEYHDGKEHQVYWIPG